MIADEYDPLDEVGYETVFISSTTNIFPPTISYGEANDFTTFLGASADVIAFGNRGDEAIADIVGISNQGPFVGMPTVFVPTKTNVTQLVRDASNEEFTSTTSYAKGFIKIVPVDRDPSRLAGTWIEYGQTQYALVNQWHNTPQEVIMTEFKGVSATVHNKSVEAPVESTPVQMSALSLTNLSITVNPHQFLEIKLDFASQIQTIEDLPPGLVLDNQQRIIGVLQAAGAYNILVKLVTGDELHGKIVCLPITRLS